MTLRHLVIDVEEAQIIAIRENEARIMLNCGHVAQPNFFLVGNWREFAGTPGMGVTGGTGYGVDPKTNEKICYDCCSKNDIESLKTVDRFSAYLSEDGRTITNWPGAKIGRTTYVHNSKAARKTFVRVIDVHGTEWYGQGPNESGTYVNLRRKKMNNANG